jgi:hypothetical protein
MFDTIINDLFSLLERPSISAAGDSVGACTDHRVQLCEPYGYDEKKPVATDGWPVIVPIDLFSEVSTHPFEQMVPFKKVPRGRVRSGR